MGQASKTRKDGRDYANKRSRKRDKKTKDS